MLNAAVEIGAHVRTYFHTIAIIVKISSFSVMDLVSLHTTSSILCYLEVTVKPRFTGPIGEKELGPVNREALYIGVHFTLIYT